MYGIIGGFQSYQIKREDSSARFDRHNGISCTKKVLHWFGTKKKEKKKERKKELTNERKKQT